MKSGFLSLLFTFFFAGQAFALISEGDSFRLNSSIDKPKCEESFLKVMDNHNRENLEEIQDEIKGPYTSVDGNDLKESLCRNQIDLESLQNEMESLGEERKDFQLRGFELKNEPPSLVNALSELIQKTDEKGNPTQNQPEISAHDYLKTLCDSAVCVAKRLFGEEIGVKVLYLKWKHGLNASHMTNEKASHIEEEEVDSFLRVASDFPRGLWPEKGNKRMVKYERGVRMISRYGGISLANSKMEFFDGWTREPKYEKDAITAHEMGHFIGKETGIDTSREWLSLSGWQKRGETWRSSKSDQLISENSTRSPQEDFAEAVTAYRYAPDDLLRANPEKYAFLKKHVFKGQEFRTLEQCDSTR